MDINFELYKVFYHVGRNRSISKAANALFISQPAVSQSIKQLETKLGGTLFIRTYKGIAFTPEGEQLFKDIEKGYDLIHIAESKFLEMIHLDSGEIRIGASDMTLKFFLLPFLETFHNKYPKVRIKVTNGPSLETVHALRSGIIDVGVVSLPLQDKTGLIITETYDVQDCFVAGNRFIALKGKQIPLNELNHYPLIMLENNTSTRRYVDQFFHDHSVQLIPEVELATSDLLVEFAKRGLGISCVVKDFALEAFHQDLLFELNLSDALPIRHFGVITLAHSPLPAVATHLLDLMNNVRVI